MLQRHTFIGHFALWSSRLCPEPAPWRNGKVKSQHKRNKLSKNMVYNAFIRGKQRRTSVKQAGCVRRPASEIFTFEGLRGTQNQRNCFGTIGSNTRVESYEDTDSYVEMHHGNGGVPERPRYCRIENWMGWSSQLCVCPVASKIMKTPRIISCPTPPTILTSSIKKEKQRPHGAEQQPTIADSGSP